MLSKELFAAPLQPQLHYHHQGFSIFRISFTQKPISNRRKESRRSGRHCPSISQCRLVLRKTLKQWTFFTVLLKVHRKQHCITKTSSTETNPVREGGEGLGVKEGKWEERKRGRKRGEKKRKGESVCSEEQHHEMKTKSEGKTDKYTKDESHRQTEREKKTRLKRIAGRHTTLPTPHTSSNTTIQHPQIHQNLKASNGNQHRSSRREIMNALIWPIKIKPHINTTCFLATSHKKEKRRRKEEEEEEGGDGKRRRRRTRRTRRRRRWKVEEDEQQEDEEIERGGGAGGREEEENKKNKIQKEEKKEKKKRNQPTLDLQIL